MYSGNLGTLVCTTICISKMSITTNYILTHPIGDYQLMLCSLYAKYEVATVHSWSLPWAVKCFYHLATNSSGVNKPGWYKQWTRGPGTQGPRTREDPLVTTNS